jgi:hypothetical protein
MAIRRLAALALMLAPSIAVADDDIPVYGPEPRPADPWAGAAADPEPTPSADPWSSPTTYDFDATVSSDGDDVSAPSDQRFAQPPPERTYARRHRSSCGGVAWRAHWRERWGRSYNYTPRLAIGIAKSNVELDHGKESEHRSLLARVVMRRGLEVEIELAKLEVEHQDARTAGISVMRVFGKRALHPYIIAGLGGGRLDVHGKANSRYDEEPRVHYAELGGGLMIRRRHLALGVDIRRGVRSIEGLHDPAPVPPSSTTRMTTPDDKMADPDHYTRARLTALMYF